MPSKMHFKSPFWCLLIHPEDFFFFSRNRGSSFPLDTKQVNCYNFSSKFCLREEHLTQYNFVSDKLNVL